MANLENSAQWSEIVEASREQSLPEVARRFGVKPGEIASALKRAGITRTAVTGTGGGRGGTEGEADADAGDTQRETQRDSDRSDDRDTQADAASESGGPAREDRDDGADGDDGEDEGRRESRSRSRSRSRGAGRESSDDRAAQAEEEEPQGRDEESQGRSSRLDPFRDLIGAIPDAAVAQQSGMSIQAVRNYRQKRGIAPAGRRRTPDEVESGRASAVPSSVPTAQATQAGRDGGRSAGRESSGRDGGSSGSGGGYGWRIGIESGGQTVHRLVVAEDAASAVARAAGAGLGEILTLERLEEAL